MLTASMVVHSLTLYLQFFQDFATYIEHLPHFHWTSKYVKACILPAFPHISIANGKCCMGTRLYHFMVMYTHRIHYCEEIDASIDIIGACVHVLCRYHDDPV